jgi:hypothetical protein
MSRHPQGPLCAERNTKLACLYSSAQTEIAAVKCFCLCVNSENFSRWGQDCFCCFPACCHAPRAGPIGTVTGSKKDLSLPHTSTSKVTYILAIAVCQRSPFTSYETPSGRRYILQKLHSVLDADAASSILGNPRTVRFLRKHSASSMIWLLPSQITD